MTSRSRRGALLVCLALPAWSLLPALPGYAGEPPPDPPGRERPDPGVRTFATSPAATSPAEQHGPQARPEWSAAAREHSLLVQSEPALPVQGPRIPGSSTQAAPAQAAPAQASSAQGGQALGQQASGRRTQASKTQTPTTQTPKTQGAKTQAPRAQSQQPPAAPPPGAPGLVQPGAPGSGAVQPPAQPPATAPRAVPRPIGFVGPLGPAPTTERVTTPPPAGVLTSAGPSGRPALVLRAAAAPAAPVARRAALPETGQQREQRLPAEVLPIVKGIVRESAEHPGVPLGILGVVLAFLLLQHRIDARDPKLAGAAPAAPPDLRFGQPVRAPWYGTPQPG